MLFLITLCAVLAYCYVEINNMKAVLPQRDHLTFETRNAVSDLGAVPIQWSQSNFMAMDHAETFRVALIVTALYA